MRLLLDTHTLLWWLTQNSSLSKTAQRAIQDRNSAVLVSAVSAWEIVTKVRLGRLDVAAEIAKDFSGYLENERFESLPITVNHGIRAGSLAGSHQDPFDR